MIPVKFWVGIFVIVISIIHYNKQHQTQTFKLYFALLKIYHLFNAKLYWTDEDIFTP